MFSICNTPSLFLVALRAVRALAAALVELAFAAGVAEQLLTDRHCFINRLHNVLALFVLAKKLFAHEEHSNAEAVALDVLVVTLAGADLLAILDGIAAQRHSRAVSVTVLALVLGQPLLDYGYDFALWKELVRPSLDVPFRELDGALHRLLLG